MKYLKRYNESGFSRLTMGDVEIGVSDDIRDILLNLDDAGFITKVEFFNTPKKPQYGGSLGHNLPPTKQYINFSINCYKNSFSEEEFNSFKEVINWVKHYVKTKELTIIFDDIQKLINSINDITLEEFNRRILYYFCFSEDADGVITGTIYKSQVK